MPPTTGLFRPQRAAQSNVSTTRRASSYHARPSISAPRLTRDASPTSPSLPPFRRPVLQERAAGGSLPWMLSVPFPEAAATGGAAAGAAFVSAVRAALPRPDLDKVRCRLRRRNAIVTLPGDLTCQLLCRGASAEGGGPSHAQVLLACGDGGLGRSEAAARLLLAERFKVAVRCLNLEILRRTGKF